MRTAKTPIPVPRAFDCLTHLSPSLADAPCLPRPLLLLLLPPLCVFCAIAPHLGLLCRLCAPFSYEIRGCVRPCSDLNSHSDFLSCQVIFALSIPSLVILIITTTTLFHTVPSRTSVLIIESTHSATSAIPPDGLTPLQSRLRPPVYLSSHRSWHSHRAPTSNRCIAYITLSRSILSTIETGQERCLEPTHPKPSGILHIQGTTPRRPTCIETLNERVTHLPKATTQHLTANHSATLPELH